MSMHHGCPFDHFQVNGFFGIDITMDFARILQPGLGLVPTTLASGLHTARTDPRVFQETGNRRKKTFC